MAKEIGWDTEENLLYYIKKQLEKLTQVMGSSQTTTTTTTT